MSVPAKITWPVQSCVVHYFGTPGTPVLRGEIGLNFVLNLSLWEYSNDLLLFSKIFCMCFVNLKMLSHYRESVMNIKMCSLILVQ